jgi:hypothetical protein
VNSIQLSMTETDHLLAAGNGRVRHLLS